MDILTLVTCVAFGAASAQPTDASAGAGTGAARPRVVLTHPVSFSAASATVWQDQDKRIFLLQGQVYLEFGLVRAWAQRGVIWFDEGVAGQTGVVQLGVYLAGQVRVERGDTVLSARRHYFSVATRGKLRLDLGKRISAKARRHPLYQEADDYRRGPLYVRERPPGPGKPGVPPPEKKPQQMEAYPRTTQGYNIESFTTEQGERVTVITGGINLQIGNVPRVGRLDIVADRMVVWSRDTRFEKLVGGGLEARTKVEPRTAKGRMELYMEGDVVLRQEEQTIRCPRLYYDLDTGMAVILDGEMETFSYRRGVPVFVRARKFRQVASVHTRERTFRKFYADDPYMTTSTYGTPGYRMQSQNAVIVQDITRVIDPKTGAIKDDAHGEPMKTIQTDVTGIHNVLLVRERIPIFYWPVLRVDTENYEWPLTRVRLRHDDDFGFSILTDWNPYKLLGIRHPSPFTNTRLRLDHFGKRGPAIGLYHEYAEKGVPWEKFFKDLNMPVLQPLAQELGQLHGKNFAGYFDAYLVSDHGKDDLGGDRDALSHDSSRGRMLWRQMAWFEDGWKLNVEAAYYKDENFLEEWFESEWDEGKDQETVVYLKKQQDIWAATLQVQPRLVKSQTETEHLPTVGFNLLGLSLLNDQLTGFSDSELGLVRFRSGGRRTSVPLFDLGTYADDHAGLRFDTRNELDYPIDLRPFKVVPFVTGRVSAWGEGDNGRASGRLYAEIGTRANVPLSKIYPKAKSEFLDVDGLAHKINTDMEYVLAGSTTEFSDLVPYDKVDDQATLQARPRLLAEALGRDDLLVDGRRASRRVFTRRGAKFLGTMEGVPIPDERWRAIQQGATRGVEVVDTIHVIRLGQRHRWQTKRGAPGRKTISDWMTLDLEGAVFPNASEDNFGEPFGLVNYDYLWNVGQRTALFTSGTYDTRANMLNVVNWGVRVHRTPRSVFQFAQYVVQSSDSNVLSVEWLYRINTKWTVKLGSSVDVGDSRSIGRSFAFTRRGKDFIWQFGVDSDSGEGNLSFFLAVTPIFNNRYTVGLSGNTSFEPHDRLED